MNKTMAILACIAFFILIYTIRIFAEGYMAVEAVKVKEEDRIVREESEFYRVFCNQKAEHFNYDFETIQFVATLPQQKYVIEDLFGKKAICESATDNEIEFINDKYRAIVRPGSIIVLRKE